MKDIFYEQLELRQPDIVFHSSMNDGNTHTEFGLAQQLADMFTQIEKVFKDIRPDKVFILGDTNSALCAIIAERMRIPVFHMESANRSFNRNIPEEVNRKLIDSISSYNLFYTNINRHTLLKEGSDPKRIFQCGNPTFEVLSYYQNKIDNSNILEKLGLTPQNYFLVDIHRSENVNSSVILSKIMQGLSLVAENYNLPVICSIHPKTKDKLTDCDISLNHNIKFLDAFGFFDFVKLEQNTRVGLTDSGLCSEEYCLNYIPCVIVRNETERPEVVEAGGAIISGIESYNIYESVKIIDSIERTWLWPEGYSDMNVSDKVVNYILSKNQ
jgi:UDP-N-acetylglucosamine 2-epimerase (non-hydrolysing)